MTGDRYLIVNADDFGQSHGINKGIIAAHENGIVTSASLMVRYPAASEAASFARGNPRLSVGLHLDLGEWSCRDGAWTSVYSVVSLEDAVSIEAELNRQCEAFETLIGRAPSHIDSHQHLHRNEPVKSIVRSLSRSLGVPLRHHSPVVRYCGSFYGQLSTGETWLEGITVEALLQILSGLQDGFTELGCHPGLGNDIDTMYLRERHQEVAVLCDSRIRQFVDEHGIVLSSFHDVMKTRKAF